MPLHNFNTAAKSSFTWRLVYQLWGLGCSFDNTRFPVSCWRSLLTKYDPPVFICPMTTVKHTHTVFYLTRIFHRHSHHGIRRPTLLHVLTASVLRHKTSSAASFSSHSSETKREPKVPSGPVPTCREHMCFMIKSTWWVLCREGIADYSDRIEEHVNTVRGQNEEFWVLNLAKPIASWPLGLEGLKVCGFCGHTGGSLRPEAVAPFGTA